MKIFFGPSLGIVSLMLALALAAGGVLPPAARAASERATAAEADLAHNTGRTYLADGRPDLAVEQFKKAIALDAKNYHAYKGLGIAYAALKKFDEAEKAQRKCLDINPDFADARNDLGATLMLLGRPAEARKEWLASYASPFNPTPDQTAWNLGSSYLDEKDLAEAQRWFMASLQHNEANARSHVGVATILMAESRLDEAIQHLEKALPKVGDDLEVQVTLGNAYYQAGRFAESRKFLEGVAKKDPVGVLGRRAAEQLKHFPQ